MEAHLGLGFRENSSRTQLGWGLKVFPIPSDDWAHNFRQLGPWDSWGDTFPIPRYCMELAREGCIKCIIIVRRQGCFLQTRTRL